MMDPFDPIESLRESFERIEPGPAPRAEWIRRVLEAERPIDRMSRELAAPIPWRWIAGSGLAAAASLAIFASVVRNGGSWSRDEVGRSLAAVLPPFNGAAIDRDDEVDDGDGDGASRRFAHADAAWVEAAGMSPQALMNDPAVQQLLNWELPSLGGIDPRVEAMWEDLAGALLGPITRLSAQLEAG